MEQQTEPIEEEKKVSEVIPGSNDLHTKKRYLVHFTQVLVRLLFTFSELRPPRRRIA